MRKRARLGVLLGMVVGAAAFAASGMAEAQGYTGPPVRMLPRPSFAYTPGPKSSKKTRLKLVESSDKQNQITDTQAWVESLAGAPLAEDFREGSIGRVSDDTPRMWDDLGLRRLIRSGKRSLLIYGDHLLVGYDNASKKEVYALDFSSYLKPGVVSSPKEREFTQGSVWWAQEVDGTLYVSTFHTTYSRSSGGQNGYITALDPMTGKLKWRSAPLTCNTKNFVVDGDAIISGYGFTEEPDFMYVLDRKSGEPTQVMRIRSGPEMTIPKDGKLFVRTYDTNYVFRLRR